MGAGLLNGVGGGIEEGETPRDSAIREAQEEWGIVLDPSHLVHVAIVDFHNRKSDGDLFTCRVYVFLADTWEGTPQESPEMGPLAWYPKDALPYEELMLADRNWLPHCLTGQCIYAESWYGPKQETLERETVVRVVSADELTQL